MNATAPFLTAEWKNIVMFNYAVHASALERFVPAGTVLDTFEGRNYVSLVGFEFNRTRIRGVAAPFHQAFEEVNLRFYVRRGELRGVAFISELVPKRAIALIARLAFQESYSRVPMSHRVQAGSLEYSWGRGPARCSMRIETGRGAGCVPAQGSLAWFITEHYWGYSGQRDGGCLEYEVRHPRWSVQDATHAEFSGNAVPYYGAEFGEVLRRTPNSAFLVQGSEVSAFQGSRIC